MTQHLRLVASALTFTAALAAPQSAHAAVEAWLTARATLGASVSDHPQRGMAFTTALTAGVKLVLPTSQTTAWMLTPDLGVAWTFGHGASDTTLGSVGLSPGYMWRQTGVAWTPRALLGARDDGAGVWGVRNGLRVSFVAGLVDVEVAHQYLRGAGDDEHQLTVSVGVDPGLLGHILARFRAPQANTSRTTM